MDKLILKTQSAIIIPNAKAERIIVLTKSFLINLSSMVKVFDVAPETECFDELIFFSDIMPPDFNCAFKASTSRLNSRFVLFVDMI